MTSPLQDQQPSSWLHYAVGAAIMWVLNAVFGKLKKVFTSPDRQDFQQLETRLTQRMAGLQTSIEQLGDKVYKRIDEKYDALSKRIDGLVDRSAGQ